MTNQKRNHFRNDKFQLYILIVTHREISADPFFCCVFFLFANILKLFLCDHICCCYSILYILIGTPSYAFNHDGKKKKTLLCETAKAFKAAATRKTITALLLLSIHQEHPNCPPPPGVNPSRHTYTLFNSSTASL